MADYYLDVVDEKDDIIGKKLKSKKRESGFISRVIAVFLRDSKGKFLMCKRAANKSDAPGLWDLAVCGNVESGEAYEKAASRELQEELGMSCELESLGKYFMEYDLTEGGKSKVFCMVYLGSTDKSPKLNDELAEFRKMTLSEIETELAETPDNFCKGFQIDFHNVRTKLKKLSIN